MKKLYSLFVLSAILFAAQIATAQKTNTYGISDVEWNKYVNKTNGLLESVDKASFLNYVLISSGDNLNEKHYFAAYIKAIQLKDRAELDYRVGTGAITSVLGVKAYLSSLQPRYIKLYAEYKKVRVEVIQTEDAKTLKRNAIGPNPSPLNCGSPCNNPGFESGTGFWDYWSGTACSTSPDPCSLVSGFSSSAHVLETVGGFDPIVGAALPLVAPGGGSSSLMIGDGSTTGAGASRASISFTVDASSTNFTYRYAVVLQDPVVGHTDPERPYFKVKLRDALGNVLACGDYEVIAKPPITGFFLVSGTTDVYYRPWTTVFVPLGAYVGQCVTLEFTSSDCSQGGHYGYAYIDADCSPSTLLTSSPAVCGGATVTLTAPSGAASYDWTNVSAGGTTGIVGSSTTPSIGVNIGGTYQVVMTSVTGALCTSTLTITVLSSPANPFANFTSDIVCEDTPTSFTDISTPTDSATAWSWDFNNDGISDSNTQNPTNTYAAGGTYPVTLTITWGPCNADTTINVTVLPGGVPVIDTIPAICAGAAPITLTETGASGGLWSGSTGITNTTTGAFDPSVATIGLNQIIYATSGMCGAADTISINVVPSSSPTWTTTTMCANVTPVNLNTLVTGTAGGTWSGTGVTGTTFDPTGLSGTYAVTYTVGTIPCVLTSTQNITVNPVPNATIASGATLCTDGASVTLVGATSGGTWSGTGVNASTGVYNPATVAPGTYVITYTIAGACGASDTALVTVFLGGTPTWTLQPSICEGAPSINLNSLVTGSAGGTWSGTGVTGNTFDPSGLSGNVSITYSVGQGPCASSSTLVINVDPIDASFTANPTSGEEPLVVDFTNGSTNAFSYFWSLGDGSTSILTDPTNTYPTGSYTVMLIATNSSGCQDTAYAFINVEDISVLTIPNIFTPNGDGANDVFRPIMQDALTSFVATIYDRWGLKMFEWTNAATGWDGKAKNGSDAPDGTYYYIVNAKGVDNKEYVYKGYLQLLREK